MQGRAQIAAGVCGHTTTVVAETADGRTAAFVVETTCDNIERFKARLAEIGGVDAYGEIDPRSEGVVLPAGRETRLCTDCVVPVSSVKALRVACGLALTAPVTIDLA